MLKPIRDDVYIRPIYDSDKTSSGLIYIPEEAKKRCDQGIVIYVGPQVKELKPGDWVFFPNYNGQLFLIDGKKVIIMAEKGVSAVLDREHEGMKIPGLFIKVPKVPIIPEIENDYELEEVSYETAWTLIAEAMAENPQFIKHRENKASDRINHG